MLIQNRPKDRSHRLITTNLIFSMIIFAFLTHLKFALFFQKSFSRFSRTSANLQYNNPADDSSRTWTWLMLRRCVKKGWVKNAEDTPRASYAAVRDAPTVNISPPSVLLSVTHLQFTLICFQSVSGERAYFPPAVTDGPNVTQIGAVMWDATLQRNSQTSACLIVGGESNYGRSRGNRTVLLTWFTEAGCAGWRVRLLKVICNELKSGCFFTAFLTSNCSCYRDL